MVMRIVRLFYGKCGLWTGLMWLGLAIPIHAAELLVIEQPDCPYCEKFDREISEIYPKTDEGSRAPIVRIALGHSWPEKYRFVTPATITPTFILVHDNQEIDRMVGYQGDGYFWFLLNKMLDQLP